MYFDKNQNKKLKRGKDYLLLSDISKEMWSDEFPDVSPKGNKEYKKFHERIKTDFVFIIEYILEEKKKYFQIGARNQYFVPIEFKENLKKILIIIRKNNYKKLMDTNLINELNYEDFKKVEETAIENMNMFSSEDLSFVQQLADNNKEIQDIKKDYDFMKKSQICTKIIEKVVSKINEIDKFDCIDTKLKEIESYEVKLNKEFEDIMYIVKNIEIYWKKFNIRLNEEKELLKFIDKNKMFINILYKVVKHRDNEEKVIDIFLNELSTRIEDEKKFRKYMDNTYKEDAVSEYEVDNLRKQKDEIIQLNKREKKELSGIISDLISEVLEEIE